MSSRDSLIRRSFEHSRLTREVRAVMAESTTHPIDGAYVLGTRVGGITVFVETWEAGECTRRVPLPPRLDIRNHSHDGFEWGYEGSGPAQLALAILAHHLHSDVRAATLYQEFKREVIARLHADTWTLTGDQIDRLIDLIDPLPHEEATE